MWRSLVDRAGAPSGIAADSLCLSPTHSTHCVLAAPAVLLSARGSVCSEGRGTRFLRSYETRCLRIPAPLPTTHKGPSWLCYWRPCARSRTCWQPGIGLRRTGSGVLEWEFQHQVRHPLLMMLGSQGLVCSSGQQKPIDWLLFGPGSQRL